MLLSFNLLGAGRSLPQDFADPGPGPDAPGALRPSLGLLALSRVTSNSQRLALVVIGDYVPI